MEINEAREDRQKPILNKEGSSVLSRLPETQLYLEGSNLNIKGDKFYESANEKLDNFIRLAKTVDNEFVLGLSKFLADNGLKLSPVVLLSVLANKNYSFNGMNLNYIFNTPQRIAEAVALSKKVKLNNSFKKHILKEALENISEFSLKKNQLKARKIKTRDLIKLLRPKPKDEKIAKLYKDIIEGKAKAEDTFVRIKSNKNLSDADKLKYLTENINKIPLNELIRNLRFITDKADFVNDFELQKKVMERLQSIDDFRFLNIFDLIETAIHVPKLEKMLFTIVKSFVDKVKANFEYDKDATILFDLSGSMGGEGMEKGFKYLVLLSLIFDNAKFRVFSDVLYPVTHTNPNILNWIREGRLAEVYPLFKAISGTALIQSVNDLLAEDPALKTLVVISDEVSWKEESDLIYLIEQVNLKLKDRKVILINPTVYAGTVFRDNIMAFASLTSAILYNVFMFINPNKFIQTIREYGRK